MIGLSSLSLDSFISVKDASGICIKDYIFLIWTKNSFSLGNLKEFSSKLRGSARGSEVKMDLKFHKWENEIIKIEFYNDSLIIADKVQVSIWNQKVLSKVGIQNLKSFSLNPEFKPNICATITENGAVGFCDLNDMKIMDVPFTWSRKGKQIACGTKTGEILFFNTNADLKNKISRPEQLSEPCYVQYIEWLQDKSFLVFYICQDQETRVIQILQDKDKKELLFLELDDPAASFGSDRIPFYFCHVLKAWDFDTLLIAANSASTDVGLIGSKTESGKLENWEALEAYQFTLPLDENQDDTWPISTALDLYSDTKLPSLTPDQPPMPSCPILWILNNKGQIMACDIMSTSALESGIQYPSMIKEIAKPSSLNVLTMNSSNNGQTKELKLSTKAAPVLQEAVKNEKLKLTQKDAKPLGNIAHVPTPTASFKEPPKSAFSFPKSIKENSKDTLLAETSSAPTIKTNSALKVKDESAAILITQFNKAYNNFQLDFSKLVNFSSDLSGMALSNKDSSMENVSSESQELSMKIGLIQDSLFEVETKFEELKSQLLHTWSKKEESDRRLRTLKTKDHEKDSNSTNSLGQALGPEAEELKKLLNIKKKKIESSILDLNRVLEDLGDRVDSQKKGKKIIGESQNWYTLCKTVQRITNAAIDANLSLDDLEKKMNQMSVSSRKKSQNFTKQFSPSKSPYGLFKDDDLLAEEIHGKVLGGSNDHPYQSKLIAFFTSDRFSQPFSRCNSKMPSVKKEAVQSEIIDVSAEQGIENLSDFKASHSSDGKSLRENLLTSPQIIYQSGATLEEKIKNLDSTPPTKNEYLKPEVKPSPLNIAALDEGNKHVQKVTFSATKSDLAPSESAPSPSEKLELQMKPAFSGVLAQKSSAGFDKFTSPFPKAKPSSETVPIKPIFPLADNSLPVKMKDSFGTKDDPENPFLVNSKIPVSNKNLKIPEKKTVLSSEKGSFSFSPVQIAQKNDPLVVPQKVVEQDQEDVGCIEPDSKQSSVYHEQTTTPELSKENNDGSDVESESSHESVATGELVNEDDLDESELTVEQDTTDPGPNLGKLDLFGDSKPKNSVNPIFDLGEKTIADASIFSLKTPTMADSNARSNDGSANVEEKISNNEELTIGGTNKLTETVETDRLSDTLEQENLKETPPAPAIKLPDTGPFGNISINPKIPTPSSKLEMSSAVDNSSGFGHAITNLGQGDTKSSPFSKPSDAGQSMPLFGQSLSATPANTGASPMPTFGQSAVFGGNNSAGQFTPTFGQSNSSFIQSTPVFGQSNNSFPQATPVFGQNTSTFGQSTPVFGQSTHANASEHVNKPSFGQSQGFGTAPKAAFGQSSFSFGSASNSNSFAALGNTTSPAPAASSFAGMSQTGFSGNQGFNTAPTTAAPLGPGQALAGNVAFGARTGLGSNAPSIGFAQPSFPNVGGTQGVFGTSSFGSGNTFGGSGSSAPSGFAAFAATTAPSTSFGSFGNNAPTAFGSAGQQNTSIFGSGKQPSTGFGSGSFNSGFGQNPSNNSAFSQHRG